MASTRTCSAVNWSISGGSLRSITPLTTWKYVGANGSLPAKTGRRGKVGLNATTKVRWRSGVFKSRFLAMKVLRAPGGGANRGHLKEVVGCTFG